jgi:hypothetical protein
MILIAARVSFFFIAAIMPLSEGRRGIRLRRTKEITKKKKLVWERKITTRSLVRSPL